ncbi:MAG: shikimate kinase [Bacillota bacterium]
MNNLENIALHDNSCEARILKKFENAGAYQSLFDKIDEMIALGGVFTIAIDGMCGSGKTFLSKILAEKYDCNIFHADSFFLQKHQRTAERLALVGGNLDFERLKEEILDKISLEKNFSYRHFSCSELSLGNETFVTPKNINILEGSYCQNPILDFSFHLKVFLCTSSEKQENRILKRNGFEKLQDYKKFWIPKENAYFEKYRVKENCDLIIKT